MSFAMESVRMKTKLFYLLSSVIVIGAFWGGTQLVSLSLEDPKNPANETGFLVASLVDPTEVERNSSLSRDLEVSEKLTLSLEGLTEETAQGIVENFAQDEIKFMVAVQTARAFEKILTQELDANEIQKEISRSVACRAIQLPGLEAREIGRKMEEIVFGTEERRDQYFEWNAKFSGRLIRPYPLSRSACDF
jgi:hypothetical protein